MKFQLVLSTLCSCSSVFCISFAVFLNVEIRDFVKRVGFHDGCPPNNRLEGQEDIINAPPAPSRPSWTATDSGPSHWQRTTWSVGSPKSGSDYKWQLLPLPTQGKPFESESVLRGGDIFAHLQQSHNIILCFFWHTHLTQVGVSYIF